MTRRVRAVSRSSADPAKPFHHVYGRNRFSGNLVLVSRNLRSYKEAQVEKKKLREASGHDYTYTISSTWDEIRG